MRKEFVRKFNPVLMLSALILLTLTACSSSPPKDVLIHSVVDMGGFVVADYSSADLKVLNKYEKTINNEKFYIYEYELKYTAKLSNGGEIPDVRTGTIALAKRGEKWFYFNNIR